MQQAARAITREDGRTPLDHGPRLCLSAHVRFAPKANRSVQSKAQKKAPAMGAGAGGWIENRNSRAWHSVWDLSLRLPAAAVPDQPALRA